MKCHGYPMAINIIYVFKMLKKQSNICNWDRFFCFAELVCGKKK